MQNFSIFYSSYVRITFYPENALPGNVGMQVKGQCDSEGGEAGKRLQVWRMCQSTK